MKIKKQQFLVAGLGRFGQKLAVDLIELGAEVFGIDAQEERVAEVADWLTHSAIANTTEVKVVEQLGVADFDAAICAIGSDLEASLMTALLLKENGAKVLVAKASTQLHGKILSKIGADRVIFPEREVAAKLARDFLAPKDFVEVLPLTVQHSIFELKAPVSFCGLTLEHLHLRRRFGLNVVAIRRGDETIVSPGAGEVVRRGDTLVVIGDRAQARNAVEAVDTQSEQ
jgi:trk system potassium uptake protein TrkA